VIFVSLSYRPSRHLSIFYRFKPSFRHTSPGFLFGSADIFYGQRAEDFCLPSATQPTRTLLLWAPIYFLLNVYFDTCCIQADRQGCHTTLLDHNHPALGEFPHAPAVRKCDRYRSTRLEENKWGPKAAVFWLAAWLKASKNPLPAAHKKYRPTQKEIQAMYDEMTA
jgi:hypothetical protein